MMLSSVLHTRTKKSVLDAVSVLEQSWQRPGWI